MNGRNFIGIYHSAWHQPTSVFYELSGKTTNFINLSGATALLGKLSFQNSATDAVASKLIWLISQEHVTWRLSRIKRVLMKLK